MPFSQLPLAWQVWGDGLLGAVLLMLCCVVGIEWPWLVSLAHVVRSWARRTFTDPAPIERPEWIEIPAYLPAYLAARESAAAVCYQAREGADVVDIATERQRLQLLRAMGTRRASWTVH